MADVDITPTIFKKRGGPIEFAGEPLISADVYHVVARRDLIMIFLNQAAGDLNVTLKSSRDSYRARIEDEVIVVKQQNFGASDGFSIIGPLVPDGWAQTDDAKYEFSVDGNIRCWVMQPSFALQALEVNTTTLPGNTEAALPITTPPGAINPAGKRLPMEHFFSTQDYSFVPRHGDYVIVVSTAAGAVGERVTLHGFANGNNRDDNMEIASWGSNPRLAIFPVPDNGVADGAGKAWLTTGAVTSEFQAGVLRGWR